MAGEQFQVPSSNSSGADSPERSEQNNAQDESADGIEKQQQHRPPHQAVGFWHPRMSKVRAHVLKLWARTVLILLVSIFGIMCLYWGVLYQVEENLSSLVVHIVDFDGQVAPYQGVDPVVGPEIVRIAEETRSQSYPTLGYVALPPSDFNDDPLAVRQDVYDWGCWAAIIVQPNATALLREAVETGNSSYDPWGSVQMIIQSARDSTTVQTYIVPQLERFSRDFSVQFGAMWGEMIMSNDSLSRDRLANAPSAVNPGVVPLMYDLRPFGPPVMTPAVSIGLIYLIITAFFSFSFFLPIHTKYIQPQGHPPLHFWQFIVWRWLATMVSYFFISLAYSLVSLVFGFNFSAPPSNPIFSPPPGGASAYGHGTFPVYWMLNFVGMYALGLACENVAMIIGQPWTALWLIFWVITNVSSSFYSLDLAPGFYQWGYAWPLHQIVEASRQVMFDLHSRIGLNFGILFAWSAVNTVLFPLCCYFMRWRAERERRKAERNKDRYVVHDGEEEKEVGKKRGKSPPVRKRGFMRGM